MIRTLSVSHVALAAAAALAVAATPLAASAYTAVAVPQPAGQSCVAVKIASQNTGVNWGAMNCSNGLAYNIKNKMLVTQLTLPAGFVSEYASDISQNGKTVGWAVDSFGNPKPYHWQPNGAPVAYINVTGMALGIVHSGIYVVGAIKKSSPLQAYSFVPGHFIGPGGSSNTEMAYDESLYNRVIVGELN